METFVDPARFTGACYRAANWQPLGRTKGFARNPGVPVTWTAHGQPKEIFVYPLVHDAREQLRALDDAPHRVRARFVRKCTVRCEPQAP